MALKNNITGQSISEMTRSGIMNNSIAKYSVVIHPPQEETLPQQEISASILEPIPSEKLPSEDPIQNEKFLREIAELKDLLSENIQKDETLVKQMETTIETIEKLPQSLQKEFSAEAVLIFDKYLKTVLQQRIGDAKLEVEKINVAIDDIFDDDRLKPQRKGLMATLLIINIIATIGVAALIVIIRLGIL